MKMHTKKMLAPIIISAIIVIYYVVFAIVLTNVVSIPLLAKILGAVIPLLIAGACIYILIERIKEIRSGEEDDLSQY